MGCGKSLFRSIRTFQKRAESLYWRLGGIVNEVNYQIICTRFLEKYGGLSLYNIDFGYRYSVDDEDIHFVKG